MIFIYISILLLFLVGLPYFSIMLLIKKYGYRKSPVSKDYGFKQSISIVIPTYNEELIVAKKLDNILELDYPLDLIEVIFIDSSTDKTRDIISTYQEKYRNIRIINEGERAGLATALNKAYSAAKNDIVVKTDCDSFLHKDALSQMVANFADKSIGAVCGKQVVINSSKVEEGYRSIQSRLQIVESWLDSTIIFHGPFSAYRKNLIVPIDPASLADDSELAVKIRKQGYRTIIDPEVMFYEASQSRFFKRRMQKDRRGKGLIRLLLQHRDVLLNSSYGKYGTAVFPMNYFMMIISPYMMVLFTLSFLVAVYTYTSFIGLLLVMAFGAVFMYLGQSDKLSIFEPIYSFIDTQISLLVGGLGLVFGRKSNGTWEVDKELRDAYLSK
ncbi:glycosyltransferase [Methanolobus sp. WCC4]|uniref:glycosyltransferase n=1 Tax=Methanolobus sp. WCC4 TaxID=3125784 RepID=UPI0030FB2829